MFTRVVEITTKTGKSHEVANTIFTKVLPVLRKQSGFLDEQVLTSDMESDRILALSFWQKKEDAERYQREEYSKVREMLSPFLESEPMVKMYNVHTSTPHKIATGKAA